MRYSKDNFLCFEILVQKLKGAYLQVQWYINYLCICCLLPIPLKKMRFIEPSSTSLQYTRLSTEL